jgi:L-seryl-tRNA(Ser) seleniumtransferase
MSNALFRQLKSVDYLLNQPEIQPLIAQSSRALVRGCVQQALEQIRQQIANQQVSDQGGGMAKDLAAITIAAIVAQWQQVCAGSLQAVINATGTVLHTNLGRAPLAAAAVNAMTAVAQHYSNLEYDLGRGVRGQRDVHCREILTALLGCEMAVVVNNNAAAVMLVLDELAKGGEALISRGEMIEIGGAFRIPDVMQKSGAILREVGTTNRTRLRDYEQAITPQTRVILRVHPSNYRIVGFTEKPALTDLVALAARHNLVLIEDLGSGCLVDLSSCGILHEPTVQASIQAGVPVVTFSGDKMLGGPQAGIIAGRREYLTRIRQNPLMRALRMDKLGYAALSATLQLYQQEVAWEQIPVLQALAATPLAIKQRAQRLWRRWRASLSRTASADLKQIDLSWKLLPGFSVVGGGSAPDQQLPTTLIALSSTTVSANWLESQLRQLPTPIIARIEKDAVVLDLRSVLPSDEALLIAGLGKLASKIVKLATPC